MVDHNVVIFLYRNAIALFCAASVAISPQAIDTQKSCFRHCDPAPARLRIGAGEAISPLEIACLPDRQASLPSVARNDRGELWLYLRKGINYLEASGKSIPLGRRHPGGKAYGPLALTPIAVKDVQIHYPRLAHYRFEDVISKRSLYEIFAFLYADLLLRHYARIDYLSMPKEEVFEILQRAWFLGPTLYKKGHPVLTSRELHALRYIIKSS